MARAVFTPLNQGLGNETNWLHIIRDHGLRVSFATNRRHGSKVAFNLDEINSLNRGSCATTVNLGFGNWILQNCSFSCTGSLTYLIPYAYLGSTGQSDLLHRLLNILNCEMVDPS